MNNIELTQFSINKPNIPEIKGEYEGNSKTGKVIVFSHGFGVKRDSWGMFNELGDLLKDEYLIVRFDYTKINEDANSTYVYSYSVQAKMLEQVIEFIKTKIEVNELCIIAHSMGSIITGLIENNTLNKAVLLAPPPTAPYTTMKEYFLKREGTEINEQGLSKVKRSDGSWTLIDKDFWGEMKEVNPKKLYTDLAKNVPTYYIRALEDHVITGESYREIKTIPKLNYLELHGNHDFQVEAREDLNKEIKSIFLKD